MQVHMAQAADGVVHVVVPWGVRWRVHGGRIACSAPTGGVTLLAVLDSDDVPVTGTCPECIKALDVEEV